MNSLQRGVIDIVYAALTGEKVSLPADFDLVSGITIAQKHKIVTMFYYGALNCGFGQELPFMQALFRQTCKNTALSERQTYEIEKIYEAFAAEKVDYMPLKGILLRDMYPKSEMRYMGDADILIKTEQYDRIKSVMQRLSYSEVMESDHELAWQKQIINIELHKRLIPSLNKDYYAYFGDGWHLAKIKNDTRYSMTDEDQWIYLFTHFAKHYRDTGIGIKHMVDLWLYRKNKPALEEEYIKKALISLQLYDFYVNVMNAISVWFDGRKTDAKTDFITDVIFNSGVYGTHEVHLLSNAVKQTKSTGSAKKTRHIKILEKLFLPYDSMCKKYPILKKVPVLLPVMWVVRGVDVALFQRKRIKAVETEFKLLSEDGIANYEQSLHYVGLDFHFKE